MKPTTPSPVSGHHWLLNLGLAGAVGSTAQPAAVRLVRRDAPPPEPVVVTGDEQRLHQVATNLLTNDATDPLVGTAEFKATAIRIEQA